MTDGDHYGYLITDGKQRPRQKRKSISLQLAGLPEGLSGHNIDGGIYTQGIHINHPLPNVSRSGFRIISP